jgi:hypothetical protein
VKKIYVSHPFSGDEYSNRLLARDKVAKLSKEHTDVVFINPLDNMMYAEKAELSYSEILSQCIAILDSCDAIIMLGNWKSSYGCIAEYKRAISYLAIPVYDEELKVIEF